MTPDAAWSPTTGQPVRLQGSNRKWVVVSMNGRYLRLTSGSGFETYRKLAHISEVSEWQKPTGKPNPSTEPAQAGERI